nr:toll-like receptor 13 [Pogona vitticeps]
MDSIKKGIFKNLTALQLLNLADNQIVTIEPGAFEGLSNLQTLILGSNRITQDTLQEGTFQGVSNLVDLEIFSNDISYESPKELTNPPFQLLKLLKKLSINSQRHNGLRHFPVNFLQGLKSIVLIHAAAVMLLMLICFCCQWRWNMIYAYHLLLAYFIDKRQKRKGQGREYDYDAFLSYNTHDEKWVINYFLPVMENQYGWKLCLHHRDFQPGRTILENIVDNIYASRKTICIISHHYLESEWCSKEIQVACFRLFDDHKDVLILIFLEDIPRYYLSPYYRMRKLVKNKTYLKRPQDEQEMPLFWHKLNMAMKTGEEKKDENPILTAFVPVELP